MRSIKLLLILQFVCCQVYSFPGKGSGTSDVPYIITNIEEFSKIRNDKSKFYKIVNDFDASVTKNWNGGKGFVQFISDAYKLSKRVDFNGYSILDIYIYDEDQKRTILIEKLSFVHPIVTKPRNNSLSLNLGGYSSIYGITYDHVFDERYQLGLGAGFIGTGITANYLFQDINRHRNNYSLGILLTGSHLVYNAYTIAGMTFSYYSFSESTRFSVYGGPAVIYHMGNLQGHTNPKYNSFIGFIAGISYGFIF